MPSPAHKQKILHVFFSRANHRIATGYNSCNPYHFMCFRAEVEIELTDSAEANRKGAGGGINRNRSRPQSGTEAWGVGVTLLVLHRIGSPHILEAGVSCASKAVAMAMARAQMSGNER